MSDTSTGSTTEGMEVVNDATGHFAIVPERLIYAPDVNPQGVRLWAALARHAGGSGQAWPSRNRLAELTGVSLDTVDRAIAQLERTGWLRVERRAQQGRSSLYRLTTPPPRGGRTVAAPGGRTVAAGGGRTDAAQNESNGEREGHTAREAVAARAGDRFPEIDRATRAVMQALELQPRLYHNTADRLIRAWPEGWRLQDWITALDGFMALPRWWSGPPTVAHFTGRAGTLLAKHHAAGLRVLKGLPAEEPRAAKPQPGAKMAGDLTALADAMEREGIE